MSSSDSQLHPRNRAFAASRLGTWLYARTLHHIEALLRRLSGGRQIPIMVLEAEA